MEEEQTTAESLNRDSAAGPAAARARASLSVLIPTRNEERNIQKCLKGLSWADEIYIVDSHSTDRTAEIALAHGAKVVSFSWDGKGPRKKNWALENIPWKHEWLLLIDADEEATPELRDEISQIVRQDPPYAGFLVRYYYYFLGRLLKHGDPLWKMSLVRHRRARFERMNVPEVTGYDVELHENLRVDGKVGRLRSLMIHHDLESLHHHFHRHNIYSDWEALLRVRYRNRDTSGEVQPRLFGSALERRRFWKRLFLSLPGRPFTYFLGSYILRAGFLDGRPGFIYNVLKSFYWYEVSIKEYELRLQERSLEQEAPR